MELCKPLVAQTKTPQGVSHRGGGRPTIGPNLLIQGSSNLIQTLLANDSIDQFNLWVFPLVLGSGKRFFGKGAIPIALTLVNTKISTTGVIMSTYLRAGSINTGSLALVEPTELEIARRQKMKREG